MNTKQFKLTSQKFSENIFFTIYPIKVLINSRVNRLFSKVFLPENIYLLLYASPHFRAGKNRQNIIRRIQLRLSHYVIMQNWFQGFLS